MFKLVLLALACYVLQCVFAYFQIQGSYKTMNAIKEQYKGTPYRMVSGTGRTRFLIMSKGYFIILVVDEDDTIIDYYGMEGFTVFARPKRKEENIGKTLNELEESAKKKNVKKALESARSQLELLRERDNEASDEDLVEEEIDLIEAE